MNDEFATLAPSPWLARFAPLIPAGGQVLDIYGGTSRSAHFLGANGYIVEAVAPDQDAAAALASLPRIQVRVADLERGPWPYFGRAFDGIVVTHYLWRPILPAMFACLAENGILIYESAMVNSDFQGRQPSPEHELRPGELLDLLHKRFTVVAFEQGEVEGPESMAIQRIVVRRGRPTHLP